MPPPARPLLVAAERLGQLRAPAAAATAGRGLEAAGLAVPDLCALGTGIEALAPALGAELALVRGEQMAVLADGSLLADALPGDFPDLPLVRPDVAWVLAALDFDARMRRSHAVVVVTQEIAAAPGSGFAWEIGTRARQAGVPLHAIVLREPGDPFLARMIDLQHFVVAADARDVASSAERLARML